MRQPSRHRDWRQHRAGPAWVAALLVAGAVLTSCSESTAFVDPSTRAVGDTTDSSGSALRAALTVHVTVDPTDSALATAIGSPGGVLRAAQVSITRGSGVQLIAISDSTGAARFTDLIPGPYSVSAGRSLSDSEVVQLGVGNGDVTGFGGGALVTVSPPGVRATIDVSAGRRGTLVISELLASDPRAPSGEYYFFGHFVELYNNSDTTIYLDRKVLGVGMTWVTDLPSPRSCAEMAQWREDPDGIWSRYYYRFPGSGREYPLEPGKTAVVATDAIDHSAIVSTLPDLSRADFEFVGPSVVRHARPGDGSIVRISPVGDHARRGQPIGDRPPGRRALGRAGAAHPGARRSHRPGVGGARRARGRADAVDPRRGVGAVLIRPGALRIAAGGATLPLQAGVGSAGN